MTSTIAAIFVRFHTNAKYTDTVLVLNGNVPNTTAAGWSINENPMEQMFVIEVSNKQIL